MRPLARGFGLPDKNVLNYYLLVDGDDKRARGENQEMGERRWRADVAPIHRFSEILEIKSQGIPANSSVWGRVKMATGGTETVDLSVVLSRHVEVSQVEPIWPAFPW